MNSDNRSNVFDANSSYYDLPHKTPWKCTKALYSTISICVAIVMGLVAAFLFAPWLFGTPTLYMSSMTLIGTYYTLFSLFAPFVLFVSCILGCLRFNKKLFAHRIYHQYDIKDIAKVTQAISLSFLKASLIYFVLAVLSSRAIILLVIIVAAVSVIKLFR